ncbi:hypothetical protein FRZ06_10790 [Anoxybacterium hadale]|uniref:Uncharacterized protein n=1 Tax=Anoxybacterium hadale TaxID=3408580 RepID=A0ACD1ABZ2_9FIRM|nr:hypothetical protein FRZ06_10790 [Clostridiales bacterium]
MRRYEWRNRRKYTVKSTSLIILLSLTILLAPAEVYAKTVTASIPTFPVTVNGQAMESVYNQYPFLLYMGITYFPMTYDNARFLNVKVNWYEKSRSYGNKSVLFVGVAEDRNGELKMSSTKTPNKKQYPVTVAEYGIALNTTNPSKYLDNQKEEYPILNFRGITYFPLTWRFAVEEFGWEYSYDKQNGLNIKSSDPFRPIISDSVIGATLPRATGTDYYYSDKYYVGYPTTTWDNNYRLIIRKRGGDEREYSLENQIQGDYYFNVKKNNSGAFVASEPSINNNLLSIECRKVSSNSAESSVILTIDLDTGKVVAENTKD